MKRPLALLVLVFSSGIFIADKIKITFLPLYFLCVIGLTVTFFLRKKKVVFCWFLCFLVFLLGGLFLKSSFVLPKCHIARHVYPHGNEPCLIRGFVASEPFIRNNRASFVFTAEAIQFDNLKYACCGNIFIFLKGNKETRYGDELLLSGKLSRPFKDSRGSRQSYRDYLYGQGIYAVMHARLATTIARPGKNRSLVLKRFALWLKAKMEGVIFKSVSYVPAGILDAMVLGERRNLPLAVNESMVKSGTVHILVVSGFNVGVVVFLLILCLKVIRLSRKVSFCIAIPCLIIYCLMTGAAPPVVRATVMSIVFLSAYLLKREPDIYNSCALAALLMLIANPRQLFNISFQLSFASVISIAYLYPKTKALLRVESLKVKFLRLLVEGCLVSFSAWVGTMGFIAYYFRIFSPLTVLANIFIVPLATLITLCGFSLVFISLIFPPLVQFFASVSELAVALLLYLNSFLIKLPGAYFYLS